MLNVTDLKVTDIKRATSRMWEVSLTATLAGVNHVGVYEVSDDNIHERYLEPTGLNSSMVDSDDDYYVITDGTTTTRIYCDDYAASREVARTFASEAIFDLESKIASATMELIAQKVA